MTVFQIISILISLTALFSYLNFRFFKLPATIGVMLIALLMSLALIGAGHFAPWIHEAAVDLIDQIDFNDALMQGMLCFLLFAGAMHIDLSELKDQRSVIATLAVASVVISMFVFGTLNHYVLGWLGIELNFAWCLRFDALISPIDPAAAIGILKDAKVPRSLEVQIDGEPVFSDGIGIVAFIVLSEIAVNGEQTSAGHIGLIFSKRQ
jgi:CPA1 family monovalent cation:H+ antiporter